MEAIAFLHPTQKIMVEASNYSVKIWIIQNRQQYGQMTSRVRQRRQVNEDRESKAVWNGGLWGALESHRAA